MQRETFTVAIELEWDGRREDARGSLAATFAAIADGIANGVTTGPLPNKGSWTVRKGAEILQRE